MAVVAGIRRPKLRCWGPWMLFEYIRPNNSFMLQCRRLLLSLEPLLYVSNLFLLQASSASSQLHISFETFLLPICSESCTIWSSMAVIGLISIKRLLKICQYIKRFNFAPRLAPMTNSLWNEPMQGQINEILNILREFCNGGRHY